MNKNKKTDGCTQFDHLVWDYFEMKPGDIRKLEIDNHLKTCESCRVSFERMAAINQHLIFQKSLTASPLLSSQVINRLRQKQTPEVRFLYNLKPLAAAAIIVFMVGAGILSGRFIAGRLVSGQTVNVADPVSYFAEETFFAEADFFTPGYELLNE